MVRGRTIDETLPLTRSLTIQREYRARKAAKIKTLEESNSRLADENAALRAEIADLKCRVRDPTALTISQLAVVEAARREVESALGRLYEVQQMAIATNGGGVGVGTGAEAVSGGLGVALAPPGGSGRSNMANHRNSFGSMLAPGTPMHRPESSHSHARGTHPVASPSLSTAGSDVSLMGYSDSSVASFASMSNHPSASAPVSGLGPGSAPDAASALALAQAQAHAHAHGQPIPMFDPNCCGGLFDCSTLPVSGLRAVPGQVQHHQPQQLQQQQPQHAMNHFRAQTPRRGSDYAQAQMPNGKAHAIEDPQAEGDPSCCYGVVDCEPKEIDM
ncbi:hypothetical protein JCM24511_01975 [Saitozyma sp. JCM 24511]|nr:hypothetical protein JCM24511_01975 [Saitozyma sp. JCM 24511]